MGLAGAAMLFYGMKSENEVTATWLGFWAGSFLWTGWVEFAFVWSGNVLNVPDLMDPNVPGEIATKAEYLVMMSSVGVLGATLVYFLLNRETKCNFFLFFQRHLKLRTGRPTRGHRRDFAAITALETIYVVWFCYLLLLFIYDESILGDPAPGDLRHLFPDGDLVGLFVAEAGPVLEGDDGDSLCDPDGHHYLELHRDRRALAPVYRVLGTTAGLRAGNEPRYGRQSSSRPYWSSRRPRTERRSCWRKKKANRGRTAVF